MPERVLLVMAFDDTGKPVAGALNLIGSNALYGRNWGCQWGLNVKFLHFELCYYQVHHASGHDRQFVASSTKLLDFVKRSK